MNGAIIPHTPIAVDFWNARETAANNCRLYFLTHAHADHTAGLTSSWKNHKIYCSVLTKKIILHKFGICEELVIGLPVNQPVVIAMDEVGKENLTVTLIDANHCPGAVLFLFQGYFGNILYTGDFRYYKSLSTHQALQHILIDKLYLDNTYCDPKCIFPTREEAANMILEVVKKHLDFNIVFGMNSLGKEDLLAQIGITFKKWIGVNPKRMEVLKLLDLPDVFTCDINSTSIRIVMRNEISKRNLHLWNSQQPTIVILPTALFEGETNIYKNMNNVFVIPYSDHSSFNELMAFVSEIEPKEIVPLVLRHKTPKGDPGNIRVNMAVFNSLLNKEPLSTFTIPETVLQFMGTRTAVTCSKVKRRTKSLTAPRQKRRKCTGVVFSDEEDADQTKIPLHNVCGGEFENPEEKNDWKSSTSLQSVNKAFHTELTSAPGSLEVSSKEELTLPDSCVLEDENTKSYTPVMDSNTTESTFKQVDIDVGLSALKKEKFIEDPTQISYGMEGTIVCTCTCKKEEIDSSTLNGWEKDIKVENERMNFLPVNQQEKEKEDKPNGENEIVTRLSNCQASNNVAVTNPLFVTSSEPEITANSATSNIKLARELLDTFNSKQCEDEYTTSNPVYKTFVGQFCEYLKTLTSEATLEVKENENGKHPLSRSPRIRWDAKIEGSVATHQKMNFVLTEEEGDDSEEEESGFNWFSVK